MAGKRPTGTGRVSRRRTFVSRGRLVETGALWDGGCVTAWDDFDFNSRGRRSVTQQRANTLLPTTRRDEDVHVSLVIPTKNEVRNIGWVLERLPACVGEIIVVDGQSTDGTVDVVRSIRPDSRIVMERRRGKGVAVRAGFAAARGRIVAMIDADGSMHPRELDRFVGLLDTGFDLVKGSRFMSGGGSTDITFVRRMGNSALRMAANKMCRTRFSDLCYGYIAMHRRHVGRLDLDADGFEIEAQIVMRAWAAGLHVAEVPSVETPRHHGDSNLRTFRDGHRVLKTLLRERALNRGPAARPVLNIEHLVAPASLPAEKVSA